MKITMYELLGLVKDNKAPKKAIYDDELLFYDSDTNDYYNYEGNHSLFYGVNRRLDAEVEIIKEIEEIKDVEEKKIPEKLGDCSYVDGEIAYSWSISEAKLKTKINEIIDYLKSKGD